jgi:AcrR family transcriptional regulator
VLSSQRARLLRAMLELIAAHGYEETTVPAVVARARVSRNAFYDLFADKAACFLAACDSSAEEVLAELYALAADRDWVQAARDGTDTYLRWWSERPALSIAYFVAMPSVGARAVEQRERNYAAFETMFTQLGLLARRENPALGPLAPVAPRALVLAITELVAARVRAGAVARLHELAPDIVYLMVKLLADEPAAQRALEPGR